jgi:hypothetical protein
MFDAEVHAAREALLDRDFHQVADFSDGVVA